MLNAPSLRSSESESGSVALAVIVLMLSAAIAATTLGQSQLAIRSTSKIDDRAAAQAGAEQGLAEAIARLRLDQPLPFDGNGQLPAGTFEYAATLTSPTTVEINVSSTVNNATRTVRALLEESGGFESEFEYTVFANSFIYSDPDFGVVEGRVGTNGTIQYYVDPPGDVQEIFTPLGTCTGCPDVIESEGPAQFSEPALPTGPTRYCADYRWFETVVDGQNGVPFLCTGNSYLVIAANLEIINPPLIIYADVNRTVYVYVSQANKGQPPSNLQLFARSSPGSVGELLLWYSDISMDIYAPGRGVAPWDYRSTGTLIVDSLFLESGRGIYLRADPFAPQSAPPTWTITNWITKVDP